MIQNHLDHRKDQCIFFFPKKEVEQKVVLEVSQLEVLGYF